MTTGEKVEFLIKKKKSSQSVLGWEWDMTKNKMKVTMSGHNFQLQSFEFVGCTFPFAALNSQYSQQKNKKSLRQS